MGMPKAMEQMKQELEKRGPEPSRVILEALAGAGMFPVDLLERYKANREEAQEIQLEILEALANMCEPSE